jgi:hypothetical protein
MGWIREGAMEAPWWVMTEPNLNLSGPPAIDRRARGA